MESHENNLIDRLLPDSTDSTIRSSIDRFLNREKFRDFAVRNSSKISAKFSQASTIDDKRDVLAELEFAFLMINHVVGLEYELNAKTVRAPDFRLEVEKNSYMGAEVRRIRYNPDDIEEIDRLEGELKFKNNESFKITDIIFEKIGQLEPGIPNIIYIRSHRLIFEALDACQALIRMRNRIMSSDLEFIVEKSKGEYESLGEFRDAYSRLSAIVFRDDWISTDDSRTCHVYSNEDSGYPMSVEFIKILENMS